MDWNNPEERREYMSQWYEANKERITEHNHLYYEENKEQIAEQHRRYRNTLRGRAVLMVNSLKWLDVKYNRGKCTITPEWILENIFPSKCIYCGATGWENLGCDRIDNSLPHTPENVVCCCKRCNEKRGTIPFDEFVKRIKDGETLLKKNRPDLSKPCIAKDAEGNVVYEFPSTREAGRNGFDYSAVAKACNGCYLRAGNHKYKGLYWYWA